MPTKLNNLKDFIISKKIYFILIFSIFTLVGFFYYQQNKSTSVNGMIREANNIAEKGQIAYAIEDYNKIVRLFPENYEAHLKLAELYLQVNEIDMAKVEYIKAMKLGYKSRYEANIAIANLYVKENNYTLAESFIKQIKNKKDRNAQQLIGAFYYNWGLTFKNSNKAESIRKFKIAYKYYKASESPDLMKLKKDIKNTYINISNELLDAKKPQEAIDILKLSLKFWNNSETHYRLAKIYEKQNKTDNAINEYKIAFKMNPSISKPESYIRLLVRKAELLKAAGDSVSAELYYTWAKKLDLKGNIPMNPDNRVILNILSAKCNEDMDKDILIPEVSLKLTNISKDKIDNLKIKIVFSKDNKPFSEEIKVLASEKTPLNQDSSTSQLNILASEPVKYVLDKHNLLAQIYISQRTPDQWMLFRNVKIIWELNPDVILSK